MGRDPENLRKWFERNRKRMRANNKRFKRKRRLMAIEYLGGKCVNCGEDDTDKLQFDHKDPANKRERFTDIIACKWSYVLARIHKFQLLCCTCHDDKSLENGEYNIRRERPITKNGKLVHYEDEDLPDWVTEES